MAKVFIAGHRGMVGSSILRHLKDTDNEIIIATREQLDLTNQKQVNSFLKKNAIDQIYLAAAKVGGIYANNTFPAEFIYENLMIQSNVIHSAYISGVRKLLFLGSSCIYPKLASQPISETELMNGYLEPTNEPYAIAKIAAIEMGNALKSQYGHKIINLMPTNLYGPNDNFSEKDSHVIPGLMFRMQKAKLELASEFKIWGSGKPMREFLYVDDLAGAIKFIIENNIDDNILNIGSGQELSIKAIAEEIKDVIGYEGILGFDSTKPDGNPRKLLDSTKILNYGWKPNVSLTSGLEATYKWFLENIKFS